MNLIQQLEQEEIARLNKAIPEFAPGDTVVVSVRVVEGSRSRLQAYEGVVIARREPRPEQQLHRAQALQRRRCSAYFPTLLSRKWKKSKLNAAVTCVAPELYYLRGLTGKAARIKEKLPARKG